MMAAVTDFLAGFYKRVCAPWVVALLVVLLSGCVQNQFSRNAPNRQALRPVPQIPPLVNPQPVFPQHAALSSATGMREVRVTRSLFSLRPCLFLSRFVPIATHSRGTPKGPRARTAK